MSTNGGSKMNGLSITGICLAVVGVLVVVWGMTQVSVSINPDFMSFATGGIVLVAIGLCMISGLPAIFQVGGICLAAIVTMLYIYSLPITPMIVKLLGFVPVIALAAWLSLKFWK